MNIRINRTLITLLFVFITALTGCSEFGSHNQNQI